MKRLLGLPLFIVALVASVLLNVVPSGYYIITPGGVFEIEPRLQIPPDRREEIGKLAFTAVYAQPGSWADVFNGWLSQEAEVVPAEEVRPSGISEEEYYQLNQRLIEESKLVAAVVGLQAAGYQAAITGQGAEVFGLLEGMPAADVLRKGDIVLAIDGQPIGTAVEAVELIRRHQVGDQVTLTILRDGQQIEVTVGTKSSSSEPGRPVIGASIGTRLFDAQLPFPIEIETENVGGPSAGMMFSLGILDGVTDGLLTRGHFVAGTGTISLDGTVGPIGGAAEKVIAAERAGAAVFLVPRENADDARRTARSIRVVPVDLLDDAVRYLCTLVPTPDAEPQQPPPCRDVRP
jgi:PDZ domain-containing protein